MTRNKPTPGDQPTKPPNVDDAQDEAQIDECFAGNADDIVELVEGLLLSAQKAGIEKVPLEHFWLSPGQRDVLLAVPGISKAIKDKLSTRTPPIDFADVAQMTIALSNAFTAEAPTKEGAWKKVAYMAVVSHLMGRLVPGTEPKAEKSKRPKAKVKPHVLFQFKITLLGSKPAIWRRIQVADCALDKFHEHIQTAMGWTNSHLHQFEIDGVHYGQPAAGGDDFGSDFNDERDCLLSKLLPKSTMRTRWQYEYDFGDGWRHEILFEGCPKKEPGKKYPLCLEGERACPPEDVGGIGGFYQFLKTLADPRHERHEDVVACGGKFDPETFDARQATQAMKKGLPEWRD